MSFEKYEKLQQALAASGQEAAEHLGEQLASVIDRDTALASMIDGLAVGMLEALAMACLVKHSSSLNDPTMVPPDFGKIQQGRVKVIEGLIEMVDASQAQDLIHEQVLGVNTPDLECMDILREYIQYSKETLSADSADEQS